MELVEANVTMSSLREEMVLERFCETASFLTETLHYKSATFTFLLFIGCPLNGRLISPALFFGPSDIITSLLFTCFISHTCLKMPSFSATRSLKKKKKKVKGLTLSCGGLKLLHQTRVIFLHSCVTCYTFFFLQASSTHRMTLLQLQPYVEKP